METPDRFGRTTVKCRRPEAQPRRQTRNVSYARFFLATGFRGMDERIMLKVDAGGYQRMAGCFVGNLPSRPSGRRDFTTESQRSTESTALFLKKSSLLSVFLCVSVVNRSLVRPSPAVSS